MTRVGDSVLLLEPSCTSVTVRPLSSRTIEMEPLSQRFASASIAYSKREQSVRRNLGVAEVAVDAKSADIAAESNSRLPTGVWILDDENNE